MSIITLSAIKYQNFGQVQYNQYLQRKNKQKSCNWHLIHPLFQMLQTFGIGSPITLSKTPSSTAETNVIQGGVSDRGYGVQNLKLRHPPQKQM